MKKGQVTGFIIIGLIIVVIFGLTLYLSHTIQTKESEAKIGGIEQFSSEALKIKPYIDDCVKQQTVAALLLSSRQEGNLPELEEIENTIENYLNENLKVCTNFEVFKEFEIESGDVSADVKVLQDSFAANIHWPLTVKQKDLYLKQDRFELEIPVKLNEMYFKVQNIADSNLGLDITHILDQELNIEIIGCNNDRIKYVVNDEDYSVDGNVFQFFFNTELKNLTGLFERKNGIKFSPYSKPGKVILRKEGQNKRLLFDVDKNKYIKGCGSSARGENYNFYLVENNKIPVGVSINEAKRVNIKKFFANDSNIELKNGIEIYTDGELRGEIAIRNDFELNPKIYYFENGWNEVSSETFGGYVVANITRKGKYATGLSECNVNKNNKTFNIMYVPIDYDNYSLFYNQVNRINSEIIKNTEEANIKSEYILRKDLSCTSLQQCNFTKINEAISKCDDKYDYAFALVGNSLVGNEHLSKDKIALIGSSGTLEGQCVPCANALNEFASFLNLTNMSYSNSSEIKSKLEGAKSLP